GSAALGDLPAVPTRRSSDLFDASARAFSEGSEEAARHLERLAKAAGTLRELCDLFEVEAARREGREARDLRARAAVICEEELGEDRKSTRLNSSHVKISYAV